MRTTIIIINNEVVLKTTSDKLLAKKLHLIHKNYFLESVDIKLKGNNITETLKFRKKFGGIKWRMII